MSLLEVNTYLHLEGNPQREFYVKTERLSISTKLSTQSVAISAINLTISFFLKLNFAIACCAQSCQSYARETILWRREISGIRSSFHGQWHSGIFPWIAFTSGYGNARGRYFFFVQRKFVRWKFLCDQKYVLFGNLRIVNSESIKHHLVLSGINQILPKDITNLKLFCTNCLYNLSLGRTISCTHFLGTIGL